MNKNNMINLKMIRINIVSKFVFHADISYIEMNRFVDFSNKYVHISVF